MPPSSAGLRRTLRSIPSGAVQGLVPRRLRPIEEAADRLDIPVDFAKGIAGVGRQVQQVARNPSGVGAVALELSIAGRIGTIAEMPGCYVSAVLEHEPEQLFPARILNRKPEKRVRPIRKGIRSDGLHRRQDQPVNVLEPVMVAQPSVDPGLDLAIDVFELRQPDPRLKRRIPAFVFVGKRRRGLAFLRLSAVSPVDEIDFSQMAVAENRIGNELEQYRKLRDVVQQTRLDLAAESGKRRRRERLQFGSDLLDDVVAIGDDRAPHPGRDVLVHLEAENAHIADRADRLALFLYGNGLRAVFDHRHVAAVADALDAESIGGNAVQVGYQHCSGFRVYELFHFGGGDVARMALDIGEHRAAAGEDHHIDDVGDGVRRQDHLLAGPYQRLDRQIDADAALVNANCMARAKPLAKRPLEGFDVPIVGPKAPSEGMTQELHVAVQIGIKPVVRIREGQHRCVPDVASASRPWTVEEAAVEWIGANSVLGPNLTSTNMGRWCSRRSGIARPGILQRFQSASQGTLNCPFGVGGPEEAESFAGPGRASAPKSGRNRGIVWACAIGWRGMAAPSPGRLNLRFPTGALHLLAVRESPFGLHISVPKLFPNLHSIDLLGGLILKGRAPARFCGAGAA